MKKPNLQRLAQRSKIYLRKASPTILSGLGAAGVIVTSVLAVRATPKALRKIRADSKTNHDGDPEAYSKLEAVKSAWVCYIPAAISGTATIFCIFGANVLNKRQQAALTSAYALLNDSYNNYNYWMRKSDVSRQINWSRWTSLKPLGNVIFPRQLLEQYQ